MEDSLFKMIEKERNQYQITKDKVKNLDLKFKKYNLDGKLVYHPTEVDNKVKAILGELIDLKMNFSGSLFCEREMRVMIEVLSLIEKNLDIKLEEQ